MSGHPPKKTSETRKGTDAQCSTTTEGLAEPFPPSRHDGASPPAVDNSRLWAALPEDPCELLAVVAKMPRGAPPPKRTQAKHHGVDPAKNGDASPPPTPETDREVVGDKFPSPPTVDTGIVAAAVAAQAKPKNAEPEAQQAEQSVSNSGPEAGSSAGLPLDFLNDFFGGDKRHIVGIKKPDAKGKRPIIKAKHFDAGDRAGQQQFIAELSAAGCDGYFSPNPIKGTLHKKAKKGDVAEARHVWIDLDPRPGEPLEAERAAMLAQLTTNLPAGVPRPNRVIDSGRGFWGYWKLDKPMPVDGAVYNDKGEFVRNNPLTETVESYGRGIEDAFGDRFADGCRNIDRVARCPERPTAGLVSLRGCCTNIATTSRTLSRVSHEEQAGSTGAPEANRSRHRTAMNRLLATHPNWSISVPSGARASSTAIPKGNIRATGLGLHSRSLANSSAPDLMTHSSPAC
jgi:hypothetical protein